MKTLCTFLFIYVATLPLTALAGIKNLESDIICPASAKAGQDVTIDLELENDSSSSIVTVKRSAIMGLWPNGELLGPFTVPINNTIPPSTKITVTNYITFKLPPVSIQATVVGIGVALCGEDFNDCNFEECRIEIVP